MHRTTATLLLAVVAATASLWVMRGKACGQFFVTTASGNVSEYTTSGATLNTSLVTGLSSPSGIAVYGSNLFVADRGNDIKPGTGTIGEYTTSGATVNASLVTGLSFPTASRCLERICLSRTRSPPERLANTPPPGRQSTLR